MAARRTSRLPARLVRRRLPFLFPRARQAVDLYPASLSRRGAAVRRVVGGVFQKPRRRRRGREGRYVSRGGHLSGRSRRLAVEALGLECTRRDALARGGRSFPKTPATASGPRRSL